MPASVLWRLRLESGHEPCGWSGRAVHALFLRCVAERDSELARSLHDPDIPRPFTCSALIWSRAKEEDRSWPVAFVRFTLLDERLLPCALEPPGRVEVGGASFAVEAVLRSAGEHPWAGEASWWALVRPWLQQERPVGEKVALHFASPTTFRSHGMFLPLPLPEVVFGSLLQRWNAFAPVAVRPDVVEYCRQSVGIARHRLQTEAISLKEGSRIVGFKGFCVFHFLERDPLFQAQVQLLADAAFYLGVGYQTAVGMGQVRRLRPGARVSLGEDVDGER